MSGNVRVPQTRSFSAAISAAHQDGGATRWAQGGVDTDEPRTTAATTATAVHASSANVVRLIPQILPVPAWRSTDVMRTPSAWPMSLAEGDGRRVSVAAEVRVPPTAPEPDVGAPRTVRVFR